MAATTAALLFAPSQAAADHGGKHCDELPVNISPQHPDWDPVLDRDNDQLACEDDTQPPWTPPTSAPMPATTAPPPPPAPGPAPEPEPVAPQPEEEPEAPPAAPVEAEPDYTG